MKKIFFIFVIYILVSWLHGNAEARNNIITGGLNLSYDYQDRQYESPDPAQVTSEEEREAQRHIEREDESQSEEERLREEEQDAELLRKLEAEPNDDLTDEELAEREAERESILKSLRERELRREQDREEAGQLEEGRQMAEQREGTADLLLRDTVYEDREVRRVMFSPYVRFVSTSERDEIKLYYALGFNYDQDDYETETDHDFLLTAHRYLNRAWMVQLTDHFVYSDDPTRIEDKPDAVDPEAPPLEQTAVATEDQSQLSNEPGRRRYKTNQLSILSEYTYRLGSMFGLGYSWDILRNEDTGIGGWEDFDRHDVMASLSYQFNPRWILDFTGHYIKGEYDPPDQEVVDAVDQSVSGLGIGVDSILESAQFSNDLQEYRVDLGLESNTFPRDPLSLFYGFVGTDFDEPLRDDSVLHQLTLSWGHELSPRMRFGLGGGPSYEKATRQDANWDYNAHADWSYNLQHSYFGFAMDKGYDQSNFTGTNQRGLVDYLLFSGNAGHTFTANLSGSLFLSYRDENREEPARALAAVLDSEDPLQTFKQEDLQELAQYNTQLYIAGVDLSYGFLRYFTATAAYTFSHQDSDRIGDDYDDHRLFFSLSVEKELFRW